MAELKTIHRATSLPLNSSKTNKSPTRSGLRSSLPPDMSYLRASRPRDNLNSLTHGHPLCTSMTEYLSTRVRLPYVPFNRARISDRTVPRRVGIKKESGQSIRSSTFDHLRRSQLCGGYITVRQTYRRAQIRSATSPVPQAFSDTQMASESDRPITYFDISIGDQPIGRVIFSLYSDLVPKTAENFREPSYFSMAIPR
jgi:hypothetical protein